MLDRTEPLRAVLLQGERILWADRPMPGLMLTGRDAFLIPFSLFWCGFIVFWMVGAISSGNGVFPLFGLPFIVFGLFFALGRFFVDAWLRGGMQYAVTDRRVLILRSRPTTDLTSLALDRLPQTRFIQRKDGSATIRFGPQTSLFNAGGAGFSVWLPSLDPTPQFLRVRDGARVFDLLQRSTASGV